MKKRILLYVNRDQKTEFNYSYPYAEAMRQMGGNSGNAVFQYALQSYLSAPDVDLTINTDLFRVKPHPQEYFDDINSKYDCVVFSPANILAEYAKGRGLVIGKKVFETLKIPVYAIGLGVQSSKEYSFDFLKIIQDEAREYINGILSTGGKIGVRGNFTAECLEKIGFASNDFTVIGCPSLYIRGRDMQITQKKVDENDFRPALNGFRIWNDANSFKWFEKYSHSIFVDQEEFYKLLYFPEQLTWKEYQYLSDEKQKWITLYIQKRIQLYGTVPDWINDLKNRGINFSFGCRVHGNIVPILAGIPAYIDLFDSRVKELAEFFDIPGRFVEGETPDPYKIYLNTDYSKFNRAFATRFDNFKDFMNQCGLPFNAVEVPQEKSEIREQIQNLNEKIILAKRDEVYIDESALIKKLNKKKITFVAHEFGLFKNHGGIASYLYQMTKYILEKYKNMQVSVLAGDVDNNCDLLNYDNFALYPIQMNDYSIMEEKVLEILKQISPDYVEVSDYGALCLKSIIYKLEGGQELKQTKFFVNNHTATRECFEWSSLIDLDFAQPEMRRLALREKAQMHLADACVVPSEFLGQYVEKNYQINKVHVLRHPTNLKVKEKKALFDEINQKVNLDIYNDKFVISLISRFEGRKHQIDLIKAFVAICEENKEFEGILVLAGNTSFDAYDGVDYMEKCFLNIPENLQDRVLLFDFAGSEIKKMIYAISDLAVMPSVYENFPVAVTEYIYNGIPVIVSRYNGISDVSKEYRFDMTFDPFKLNQLKDKILQFYNYSDVRRKEMANKQLQELVFLTNPKRSIFKKLDFYYQFTKENSNKLKFIKLTDEAIFKDISVTGVYRLILAPTEEIAEKFISFINKNLGNTGNAICFFENEMILDVEGKISKSSAIYFSNIKIAEEYRNVCWSDFLADWIFSNRTDIVIIPIITQIEKNKKYEDAVMNLRSKVYKRMIGINLEERYAN